MAEKKKKETTERAKAWKCVRIDDKKGFRTKFNKAIPNESMGEVYNYSVKCVEHGMRGFSPTSVASKKKFQKYGRVSEGLKPKPLPEGFQSFSDTKKRETVKKIIDEFYDELAAAMSRGPVQGVDIQADYPDNKQVGAGSARPCDMTVREDVGMQVNNPGQIQVDEVWAAAPDPDLGNTLSNDASLQSVSWNLWDNFQGQPPSRSPVPLEELDFIFKDLKHRASRFPGIWPRYKCLEEALRSFVNQLESLEGALKDDSYTFLRSREEEVYSRLDFSHEDLPNVTSMPESWADEEFWSNLLASPEA